MVHITRRDALKQAAAGSLALSASGLLAACGSGSGSSTGAGGSGSTDTPQKGGTLTAAITGGSSSDTLNPLEAINNADFARTQNLFDSLAEITPSGSAELSLAEEITPNATATVWTVRLRRGVEFHDGRELTAKDVVHTFKTILNPKAPTAAAAGLAPLDAAAIKAKDKYTVQIPCKTPFATLVDQLAYPGYSDIIPEGFDARRPIGTGPFKFESFTPGQQSVFTRFDNYWQAGKPYVDRVVITDYGDETSQVNALVSGQASVANLLSTASIGEIQSGGQKILISSGGGFTPFTMRVDVAPFNDVRVRQALRLVVDRRQMLDVVFGGHGTLGNDVFGIWSSDYDHSLPQRTQDIEQAKSLLKQAGQTDLRLELVTAPIAQGVVTSAQALAQQASAAGIKINIRQVTVTEFYGANYLKWPFAQDWSYYDFYLPEVTLVFLPTSPFNETHFNDPTYTNLYKEAVAAVDPHKRRDLAAEMQQIDYARGAYILPFFPPVIDGYAANVHGLVPSKSGLPLNGYNFRNVWLA
jgi:peptide/nickel transport system substrate-binding protein